MRNIRTNSTLWLIGVFAWIAAAIIASKPAYIAIASLFFIIGLTERKKLQMI